MDNLSPDISVPPSWKYSKGTGYRLLSSVAIGSNQVAGIPWNQWPESSGIAGRNALEWVAGMAWNRWPEWPGIRNKLRYEQIVESGEIERFKREILAEKGIDEEVGRDGGYIAYANGIVKDTKTGLEWVAGSDKDVTWDQAKAWVEGLNVDGEVGGCRRRMNSKRFTRKAKARET